MKKLLLIFVLLTLSCSFPIEKSSAREKSLTYHSYASAAARNNVIAKSDIKIKGTSSGQTVISRHKQTDNCMVNDKFTLDRENSLERWRRICLEDDTDYISERQGSALVITGKFKGKDVQKEIELGEKPLHIYPKYSLGKFAKSDVQEMRFWTLRRDQMSKLPMKAVKKGDETIVVNGRKVKAVKVYYTITGKLREKQFHHNYYYRKSDGLFIRKIEKSGRIEELVKEK